MKLHLAVAVACTSVAAHAASFDCSKAQRPVEHVICSNPQLNTADEALGSLYRDALAKLSSGSVGLMRADQVQWLAWVQQVCPPAEHTPDLARTAACMLPLYRTRVKVLRTAAIRRNGVTFFTRSQYFAAPDNRTEFKDYGDFHGTGTLEAAWPAADSADPQWQAWNHAMEARMLLMALADEDEDARQTPPHPPEWSSALALERNATVTGMLRSMEQEWIVVSLRSESMGIPGAHPSEAFETDTWLLRARRLLQVHDVFAPGDAWKPLVASACYAALKAGNSKGYLYAEINGPAAAKLQEVISNTHNWHLKKDGLHITYPEYAVAPRMAEPDDTVLRWATLKPVLAAGFSPPQ